MPRNKTMPREYVDNPQQRNNEKLEILLGWLTQFHYSTRKILLERLGLNTNSHHRYFKSLVEKQILQKIRVYAINERFIFMLTNLGKNLASELSKNHATQYNTDPTKINFAELRHTLAIQYAVLSLMNKNDAVQSEKYLDKKIIAGSKKPDAAIISNEKTTILEVELSPKKEDRIFKAFTALADGLLKNYYQKVIYIFPDQTLKKYYTNRFNLNEWPKFTKDKRNRWLKDGVFIPDNYQTLREKFEFIDNPKITKNL